MTRRCPCCSCVVEIYRQSWCGNFVTVQCDGCGLYVPRLATKAAAIAVVREIRKSKRKEPAK